jgi:hypothetical protein
MQRSLIGRLEALEEREPNANSVGTILVTLMQPSEHGPVSIGPTAIKETRGGWRLEREPGEAVEDFRQRALRLCPRAARGVTALTEVSA